MPVSAALLARQRRRAHKGGLGGLPTFNPPPGLSIGGADFSAFLVKYSQSIRSTISPFSGVFRCQLDGPAATMALVHVEQELTYNRDGVQYAGRIRSVIPEDQILASANQTLTIECQDFTTLLDRDICAYAVSAPQVNPNRTVVESDVQRIGWLLQSFGRQGATLHHVLQNYATVPATDYTGMTLRKAVESVLAYSGASYYIDFTKDLHCYLDEKQYAPFTLSETPDDVSSVAYAGFNLPADSIDLRNAIYGIPGSQGAAVDTAVEIVSGLAAPGYTSAHGAAIAGFRRAGPAAPTLVRAGPFASSGGASVSPVFGQLTTAGNLLVACVKCSSSNDVTCTDPSWKLAADTFPNSPLETIWYKPNCGSSEVAPTFNSTAAIFQGAQLVEFAGCAITSPLDQTGTFVSNTPGAVVTAVSTGQADQPGDLVIVAFGYTLLGASTASFSATLNNGINIKHLGDSGATNQDRHASFWWGTGLGPTWYTDDASIALYGRQEASFTDTTVTAQADLDALGAAALATNSQPRQEGTFRCRRVGLAVGQRLTIQSSLYTIPVIVDPLGNYSGIIQSVEVSYAEDEPGPLFHIDFLKPTMTLAVQLGQVVAKVNESPAVTLTPGTLGYAEVSVDQTGIGVAFVDLVNLTVTVPTGSGRRIRVSAWVRVSQNTSASIPTLRLLGDGILLSDDVESLVAGGQCVLEPKRTYQPVAGSHTYKLQLKTNAGTVDALGSQPVAWILVEDIGT